MLERMTNHSPACIGWPCLSVYKRTKNGKVSIARNYRGRYRLDGDAKITDIPLHTTDKRVAQQKLEEIVRRKQLEAAGVLPPEAIREAAIAPINTLLKEYLADLKALGRAEEYIYIVQKQIEKLVSECRWLTVKEVTPNSFSKWRSVQRKAAKTLNEYLASMNAFLNWLKRNQRVGFNPLKSVEKVQANGRQVRKRRALTSEEMTRLLSVAGPRKVVYLAAVFTGLRRGELEALEWGDLKLDAPKPFLSVRASTAKNRKDAVMMLHPDLLVEFKAIRPKGAGSQERVFAGRVPSMEVFRTDLAKAKIRFLNERGYRADFHSLRHTLATNLALAGTAPRVAMEVMRHSDIRLTANVYTDAGLLPVSDAVTKLPSFGTKVATSMDTPAAQASQIDSQKMFRQGRDESTPVPGSENLKTQQPSDYQGSAAVVSGSVMPSPEIENGCLTRTRT